MSLVTLAPLQASFEQWNDWRWQMRNNVRSPGTLASMLGFQMDDYSLVKDQVLLRLPLAISPHLVLQIKRLQESGQERYVQQLLRTVLPTAQEAEVAQLVEIKTDGMGTGYRREQYPGLPFLLRRLYPDRLVFCVSFQCPVLCRYCFRGEEVGKGRNASADEVEKAFRYIESWNTENPKEPIRDIIFTGGDPLSLSDKKLSWVLGRARSIKGVKVLRIDTKFPTAIPQRFTPELVSVLQGRPPLFMTLHLIHPGEFAPETEEAINRLVDAGIPLGTYTPLLRGINDNAETLKDLFLKCIENRIRPYYLVHFIETPGAQHFRVPVERGLELLNDLHGRISGIALPQYIVYLPDGGGKVRVEPTALVKRTQEGYWFRNWEGRICLYPDPDSCA